MSQEEQAIEEEKAEAEEPKNTDEGSIEVSVKIKTPDKKPKD